MKMTIRKDEFRINKAPHIIMVTNHGVHEWQIVPGLKDTGGQNIFVNQFTDALVILGFKVTIVNRGGYPHPITGAMQSGTDVKDQFRRIIYLEDNCSSFVRKEDMHERVCELADGLIEILNADEKSPEMIISHYWDAAVISQKALSRTNKSLKHIWVPHSLGEIKKQKTTADENIELRMDERVAAENSIIGVLDTIVATSETVRQSLEQDYGYSGKIAFIPPCIDTDRYFPFEVEAEHEIYRVLKQAVAGGCEYDFSNGTIITEISRTDTTKRKDILIKAFAEIAEDFPGVMLAVTIDEKSCTGRELVELISELKISSRVAVLGSIWEYLPALYNITDIYCSPSVMEGFGMSVQEAAACRTAVIASELIPFAVEYLSAQNVGGNASGAIIVRADDINGFAESMRVLLNDKTLRDEMAENAYKRTIPEFTWNRTVKRFFADIGCELPGDAE